MKKNERIRVNMRLPAELVRWAKKYSKRHGKTFTSAVERGLQMYKNETEWRSDEVAIVEEVMRRGQNGRASTISR
jgi:predicted DNA-binding protein